MVSTLQLSHVLHVGRTLPFQEFLPKRNCSKSIDALWAIKIQVKRWNMGGCWNHGRRTGGNLSVFIPQLRKSSREESSHLFLQLSSSDFCMVLIVDFVIVEKDQVLLSVLNNLVSIKDINTEIDKNIALT